MTATTQLTVAQALRRAAARATLAPSIHNSQPWRFVLTNGVLEMHADRSRQLHVLDPACRQLLISCGCALFNARVALAAAGYPDVVHRFPVPTQSGLLAQISVGSAGQVSNPCLGVLDPVIELRHSNRRRFADERVPAALVDHLIAAAAAEGAALLPVTDEAKLVTTAVLAQRAAAIEDADPAYRAELRAWTTDEPDRADGVPAAAVPRSGTQSYDDIPIRDFDTRGTGGLPAATHSSIDQCLLLLWTPGDNPLAWLQAGEGLQRALLELTRQGYVASIMSQVAEVPAVRAMLRRELDLTGEPHLLLRVGRAPMTPATRRRRLVEVLVEHL
ncbi:MAG TPA: nitroreductase family protein [Jatrophihabitans sp.]|nr:nitroreductase family protein [Jatrophihabitans sp.]